MKKSLIVIAPISVFFATLMIVIPTSSAIISPIDTTQKIGSFGENVEVFLTGHSTPGDKEIIRAEHKITRLEDKADDLQMQADDATGAKKDRLQARADRAEDRLCSEALNQQQKLAAKGKASTIIDGIVASDRCNP